MIDVDLETNGKHFGAFYIPHSTNESGAGRIEIPVISIRNGEGPTILCMAGVHGDEFEGQLVWTRLAREIEPSKVRGQLIIVPAANVPSAVVGSRVSPIDQGNLNRLFPGSPSGSVTERIAHVIEHELIAPADFLIDLHGGGNSFLFLPGPTVTHSENAAEMASLLELLEVFGATRGYVFDESGGGAGGTLGACRRHRVGRLGTEIGGGGSVSPACVRMMLNGVIRVLVHLKVLAPSFATSLPAPERPQILRRRNVRSGAYIYTPDAGLFVPTVELGDTVKGGQALGEVLWPEVPSREPLPVHAAQDGIVMARRRPGRTLRGDCLAVLAEPYSS